MNHHQTLGKNSLFKSFWRLISYHFWLKLLSLFFAFVLFFIVRTDKSTIYERVAKIKILTPPSIAVIGSNVRYVNVSVKLQNTLFDSPPTENELTGEVLLASHQPGHFSVKISHDNFHDLKKKYTLILEKPYLDIETSKIEFNH